MSFTNGHSAGFLKNVAVWVIGSIMTMGAVAVVTHEKQIGVLETKEEHDAAEVAGVKAQMNRMETKLDRLLERRN